MKKYYLHNRDRAKQYYLDNRDRIKEYQSENHHKLIARKKIYNNNRYKTDNKFRLIRKTRSRNYKFVKGMIEQSSTKEILGIDVDLYKKWIEYQMTPEMNWTNIEIDHVRPICMFDVSVNEKLKEAFNWRNTQPLFKKDYQQKVTKYNFLDYQLQFIEAYQFLNLNVERHNEDIH